MCACVFVCVKTYVDESMFKDGVSQLCAEPLFLARVVSHVLQHRCTVVKDNTTSLLEFTESILESCESMQGYPRTR